jgi:hypothetical protein
MSFLKNAIEALDPAPNKKTELTLALQVLFELAEQKSTLFKRDLELNLRTAGTPDNQTIPVTQILAWHSETRAYVKSDAGKVATVLLDSIKKFIGGGSGEILDGISQLATAALEGILGAGSGTQAEFHSYYIVVEGLSIVRMDISGWSRRIEATGITTQIENALAFQAAKSSVNVDAITFNTFLQAYKAQLEKLNLPPDKLKEFILQSKEIFELLRDDNGKTTSFDTAELVPPGEVRMLIDGRSASHHALVSA